MSETLTARIERCTERWNALKRHASRAALAASVTNVAMRLADLAAARNRLAEQVERLERELDAAEEPI